MLRCLLATLGKDAPGVNAVIRAVTRVALRRGMEVFGARRGFLGLLHENFHKMKENDVSLILGRGGSVLGSSDFRTSHGDKETLAGLARTLRKFDLVVAVGGLGSFAILNHVYASNDMGLTTTFFVPASVENDFLNPKRDVEPEGGVHAESVGADSAANTATAAIDHLREQSYLSQTVFLVQCAGAKSNFLPLQIGMACGAHRVYLPKYPMLSQDAKGEIQRLFGENFDPNMVNVKELVAWIEEMFKHSKRTYLLVIIPHGIPMVHYAHSEDVDQDRREDYESIVTSTAPMELTVLRIVDDLVMHFAGAGMVQVRYVVLDDLQRGGTPTARDRLLGSLYGEAAVEHFLSVIQRQDISSWGNLNLLAVDDITVPRWKAFRRQDVVPLFQGATPRAGGLDPLPFFRRSRSTVSVYGAAQGS
jgi:6-phosphofructokinase